MTELDQALDALKEDKRSQENQARFYDLFLNSQFYIPTKKDALSDLDPSEERGYPQGMPLVLEAEGNDYLVLFDTPERLMAWAEGEVPYLVVPGHVIAETSTHPLHWVLNLNCDPMKIFVPDEIEWLKDAVARCKDEASGQ